MSLLTLKEWNKLQPIELSEEQVRRDIRDGKIYPPPVKYGRAYVFEDCAVRINLKNPEINTINSGKLLSRIKNGRAEKNTQN